MFIAWAIETHTAQKHADTLLCEPSLDSEKPPCRHQTIHTCCAKLHASRHSHPPTAVVRCLEGRRPVMLHMWCGGSGLPWQRQAACSVCGQRGAWLRRVGD